MSAPPIRRAARGRNFALAARLPVGGTKRRKVVAMLGAYADAGISDPSIRELAAGTRLPKPVVCKLVDKLEEDGLVDIKRSRGERNVYTLLLGPEGEAA